jgi:hypothetical protein
MSDYTIRARFEAACQQLDLVKWLTTPSGIAGWWSDSVSGEASSVGDRFRVRFPTTDVEFQLDVEKVTETFVAWHVPESPPWWQGTTIAFQLSEGESGGASLLFTHGGFEPDDPIIEVITPAWVRFLDNLVEVAETGRANPAVVN